MFVDASRMRCLTHCIRPWQICSFYALFLLVPASVSDNWTYDFEASVAMRGTEADLRTTQSCFLLYVFFVVLAVLLLAALLRDVMQNASGQGQYVFCLVQLWCA